VSLKHQHGRLVLEVPLPSRKEKCLFFLRPMLMTVGDLIADLQREDSGATASLLSTGTDFILQQVDCMLQVAPVRLVRLGLDQPERRLLLTGCLKILRTVSKCGKIL
ncbi:hypothetical protein XENOCAPTIV_019236, partial [Xenoophorus captivus]